VLCKCCNLVEITDNSSVVWIGGIWSEHDGDTQTFCKEIIHIRAITTTSMPAKTTKLFMAGGYQSGATEAPKHNIIDHRHRPERKLKWMSVSICHTFFCVRSSCHTRREIYPKSSGYYLNNEVGHLAWTLHLYHNDYAVDNRNLAVGILDYAMIWIELTDYFVVIEDQIRVFPVNCISQWFMRSWSNLLELCLRSLTQHGPC
jgi:hypothetical protein